jgi:FkbM family methyltransferase
LKPADLTEAHIALQLFPGYSDADKQIFLDFSNPAAKPEPGFIVDFLGSRIRTSLLWKEARTLDGQLIGLPDPGDFHSEAIEWIGLLKAVRTAKERYVAMEVGAGFGPWVIAGGVAAQSRGIQDIRLYAVEGDSHHFRALREHFSDNGFDPNQHTLIEAAVGATNGETEWPAFDESSSREQWGSRPLSSDQDYTGQRFERTRRVRVIALRDLLVREPEWDLIHIDVQGHEVEICRSCIDELTARVRWVVAGTHSRKLDGDLLHLMYSAGWSLEHEKPSRFRFTLGAATLEAMTVVDGTQVWRNPRLPYSTAGQPLNSFAQEITSRIEYFRSKAGQVYMLPVLVKNVSSQLWFGGSGPGCVDAGYRWFDAAGNQLPIEGNRAFLSRPVIAPGENDSLELPVLTPPCPGTYKLFISMVQEQVAWFYQQGATPLIVTVDVE